MLQITPNGLPQIIQVFGSLDDPNFEKENITQITFPYPLRYNSATATRGRCHKLIAENLRAVFIEIKKARLDMLLINYGGIYARRAIRGFASHPSTHSWGIAIDCEPQRYPLGSDLRFDQRIVDIFTKHGFFYGGDFIHRKDPMHFQFCSGY